MPGWLRRNWSYPVSALVVALVAFAAFQVFDGGDDVRALDCASVTGADDTARLTPLPCDDGAATFRVVSRGGSVELGCPDGAYRELRTGGELTCLMPNFQEGRCYAPDDANRAFTVVACEDPSAIRITKVVQGTADTADCPGGNGLGYPDPPVAICIETPTAGTK
jgi:hypothetical protein